LCTRCSGAPNSNAPCRSAKPPSAPATRGLASPAEASKHFRRVPKVEEPRLTKVE
jgi:hypothetical protein